MADSLQARAPRASRWALGSRCVERWHASQPGWGLVFFGSDRLVAMRTKAAADVRWDVFVPQYRADCDFYQSLKVSGWSLLHCDAGRVVNAWQARLIAHLQSPVSAEVCAACCAAAAAAQAALGKRALVEPALTYVCISGQCLLHCDVVPCAPCRRA